MKSLKYIKNQIVKEEIIRLTRQRRKRRFLLLEGYGQLSSEVKASFAFYASRAIVGDSVLQVQEPNDRTADFTVDRNSVATYVDQNGVIQTTLIGTTNLILWSENLIEATAWNKVGTTVTSNDIIAPDGNLTGDKITSTGTGRLIQLITSLPSTIYTVSFWARNVDTLLAKIGVYENDSGSLILEENYTVDITLEWKLFSFTFTTTVGGVIQINLTRDLPNTESLYVWGAQLEEGPVATEYIKTEGSAVMRSSNIARIDYTYGIAELLCEPQSTNLITWSDDFTDASWIKNGLTVLPNQIIAPDGNLTFSKLIPSTTNEKQSLLMLLTLTQGEDYTSSFYFKKGNYKFIQLREGGGFGNNYINIDLSNGDLSGNIDSEKVKIDFMDNDLVRIKFSNNLASSTSYFLKVLIVSSLASILDETFIGDGISGVYIWGAQVEQLPYATSYIKTEGSTVTRLGDIIKDGANVNVINSEEGTLYVEMSALYDDDLDRYISIEDEVGNFSNNISLRFSKSPDLIYGQVRKDGLNSALLSNDVDDETNNYKYAVKYKINDFAIWSEGIEKAVDTLGDTFTPNLMTNLKFMRSSGGTTNFYGRVRQIKILDRALTDTELATLTAANTTPPNLSTLIGTDLTDRSILLSCRAGSQSAISKWEIFDSGVLIETVNYHSLVDYTLNNLTANTAYSLTVKATDEYGNVSVASNIVDITTLEGLTLLFKSGFEGTVAVSAYDPSTSESGQQLITGSDGDFIWADSIVPEWGDNVEPYYNNIHVIKGDSDPQDILTNELVTIQGHNGVATTALAVSRYHDPNSIQGVKLSQTPYQINNITIIPPQSYQNMWIKFDGMDSMLTATDNIMLWQYKSENLFINPDNDPSGIRLSLYLVSQGGVIWWQLKKDIGGDGGIIWVHDTLSESDKTMGVNLDGWNFVEILVGYEKDDTGRVLIKLNGITLFNEPNTRTLGLEDSSLQFLTFWQYYGNYNGTYWIDDVALWSDDPHIPFVNVTSVSILPATDTITNIETTQLVATVLPTTADNKYVKWTSSDEGIATVDDLGLVTGVSSGVVTITGTTDDGDFTDTSAITVNDAYGEDLIAEGDFSNGGVAWNIASGWSVGVGETLDSDGIGSANATQDIGAVDGTTYRVIFDITAKTSGFVKIGIGGTVYTNVLGGIGTYTLDIVCDGNVYLYIRSDSFVGGSVDNVSVREIL